MKQNSYKFSVHSKGQGLYNITQKIKSWTDAQGFWEGLLTVFCSHTSASLIIQENADPDVLHDLNKFLKRIVPENDPVYRHKTEGSDDMPAHIRSALTHTHLSIPISEGRLTLGTWQGLYLFEHRTHPHHRTIALHLLGE
tara:strand:+ start:285 stop:704 length:420 start_codon:yes stop_codon:yes gene_type:complete